MKHGSYRTMAGSEVLVSGMYGGIYSISFDWVEEENACVDCKPSVHDGYLTWSCDLCGGGSAELKKVETP